MCVSTAVESHVFESFVRCRKLARGEGGGGGKSSSHAQKKYVVQCFHVQQDAERVESDQFSWR